MVVPDLPRRKTTSRARRPLPFGTKFRHEGEPAVAHSALVQGLLELGLAGKGDVPGGGRFDEGGEVLLLRRGDADGVEVALLLALEEPDAPGKGDEDAAGLGGGARATTP